MTIRATMTQVIALALQGIFGLKIDLGWSAFRGVPRLAHPTSAPQTTGSEDVPEPSSIC
jgi:hypothetical protein